MHPVLVQALIVGTAATTGAQFLDKDTYIRNVAPKALARIEKYRAAHSGNLTLSQIMTGSVGEGGTKLLH